MDRFGSRGLYLSFQRAGPVVQGGSVGGLVATKDGLLNLDRSAIQRVGFLELFLLSENVRGQEREGGCMQT